MWELMAIFVSALGISFLAMPILIKKLVNFQVMDVPNQRSSHTVPVPRGGGLLVVAIILLGLFFSQASLLIVDGRTALSLSFGISCLAILGFWDDLKSLQAKTRLLLQVVIIGLSLFIGNTLVPSLEIPILGTFSTGWAGKALALIFVVGFTNMFNFMDGIDGIAGFQSLIAAVGLGALALVGGSQIWLLILALQIAGTIGFLTFNFPKARVFLGDVGSLPLGFLLAIAILEGKSGSLTGSSIPLWVGVFFIWPFLFEATATLLVRLCRGRNPFHAHRNHLYQKLVAKGFSHAEVSTGYAIAMLACSICGVVLGLSGIYQHNLAGWIFWIALFVSVILYATGPRLEKGSEFLEASMDHPMAKHQPFIFPEAEVLNPVSKLKQSEENASVTKT